MHSALGEVTLEQLLATWVAHDLNHLAQVAKAMASQYSEAVGPWREYLGILAPSRESVKALRFSAFRKLLVEQGFNRGM